MLVLVFVISAALAWLAIQRDEKRNERRAVVEVEKLGGHAWYDYDLTGGDEPPGPRWLRALLGDDFFVRVEGVSLTCRNELSDADLVPLEALVAIEHLSLDRTSVSDAGLPHLRSMRRLKALDLGQTRVTDAGLKWLKALTHLEHLVLKDTLVTAAGIAELQAALPNCKISRYDRSDDGKYLGLAPIHAAAITGDLETIRDELAAGVPVDLRVKTAENDPWNDTTPLTWAAARGQAAVVWFLIAAGANSSAASSEGVTPLMAAAGAIRTIDGDPLACLSALLEAGADPDETDHRGRTALFYACGKGAFFDEPPNAFLLADFRLPDTFRLMRPYAFGNGTGGQGASQRFQYIRHGDADRVMALVSAGADVNAIDGDSVNVLMTAAFHADAQRLRALLDAGANVHYRSLKGGNALRAAASDGDIEMFTMLFDAEAVPEHGLLSRAAGSDIDAAEKVQLLLAKGADIEEAEEPGRSPLLASLEEWSKSTAAPVLLQAGADPHVRNAKGESTLLLAAESGPADAVRLLLELGLNPNERSKSGEHPTPLVLAAESDREAAEKVRWLLAEGADVEATDDQGATALLVASRKGNMQAVVALAEAGAAVNIVDGGDEMTPLLYVANRGTYDDPFMCEQTGGSAAQALIRRGADMHASNVHGHTARILAEAIHHSEVIQALDEIGN